MLGRHEQVLDDGQVVEQLDRLERTDQAPPRDGVRRQAVQDAILEADRSCPARRVPSEGVDEGGLTGAVGADQPDDLPGLDVQRDVIDSHDAAVGESEPIDLEERRHGLVSLLHLPCSHQMKVVLRFREP